MEAEVDPRMLEGEHSMFPPVEMASARPEEFQFPAQTSMDVTVDQFDIMRAFLDECYRETQLQVSNEYETSYETIQRQLLHCEAV